MRHGGRHAKFEEFQSFRAFEDEIVDCGVFSDEWRDKLLAMVENCMKHAYNRGLEHGLRGEDTCQLNESSNTSSDQPET